ncbi:MurR/RpiR family transcriptional regulator [Pseudothermotoga thermarum]|uniref:Transcriptional regulator, RpiR family n=1 Tax=Pseudothermotoga thermarum DSM 5069 TaxID=688269 RepID=F7YVC6_9THEM|nr:MurR/RpiR family transcriptional regulator [Pseudothermotoga thermarum]AEH50429.1 transcriptional regulator, RpiR family [Pseudothermotoga thermarum DSM 5069]
MEDVQTIIKVNQRLFTKKEKKLAEFVITHPEDVIDMSVTEVADTLGIGEGTVVRFCQKLGFTGFHAFKIALAKSLGKQEELARSNDILNIVKENHIKAIEETSNLLKLNEKIVYQCAEKIANCRRLYLLGVGASGVTALDAYYKFMRIGIDARHMMDPHLQIMDLSSCCEKDCVLAFSQSGSTAVVVDMAKLAKQNGACVIAITGYNKSPLTSYADFILLTAIRENPFQSGAIRSKIAQLHVLEVLFEQTCLILSDKARKSIDRTARAVEDWIY